MPFCKLTSSIEESKSVSLVPDHHSHGIIIEDLVIVVSVDSYNTANEANGTSSYLPLERILRETCWSCTISVNKSTDLCEN